MNKREKKNRDAENSLFRSGWSFDGEVYRHRTLSPEGSTLEVALRLNQDKKIDPAKLIKQIMRKGR